MRKLVLVLLVVAFALVVAAPALARGPALPPGVSVSPRQPSDAAIRAYWTPARMAAARPMPFGGLPGAHRGGTGMRLAPPVSAGPPSATASSGTTSLLRPPAGRAPASSSYQGNQPIYSHISWGYASTPYIKQTGRIYFTTPQGTSACTGTVVAPSVVMTAAHCVRALDGTYYSNWTFVPAQTGPSKPYGTYTARDAISYDWYWQVRDPLVNGLGFGPLDYAFLAINAVNGQQIGNRLGWWGILINPPFSGYIYHTGYSGSGPFAANCSFSICYQWTCYSTTNASQHWQPYTGWYERGMGCVSGHGSSGGPFFQYWNNGWYLGSDMSTCWSSTNNCANQSDNVWGPYYNSYTLTLFNQAKTL